MQCLVIFMWLYATKNNFDCVPTFDTVKCFTLGKIQCADYSDDNALGTCSTFVFLQEANVECVCQRVKEWVSRYADDQACIHQSLSQRLCVGLKKFTTVRTPGKVTGSRAVILNLGARGNSASGVPKVWIQTTRPYFLYTHSLSFSLWSKLNPFRLVSGKIHILY